MKVTLKNTLILKNEGEERRVGPGEVEMSEARARSLGLLKQGKQEAAPAASRVSRPKVDPFEGLAEVQVSALKDAGFTTASKLRKGLESGEVAAISGIGTATVEKLAANLKG